MYTHKHLMALLNKLGYTDELRHELIYNFTEGRTHSTTEITPVERQELCIRLQSLISQTTVNKEDELRNRRSQVLAVATRLGIKQAAGWDGFNRFMLRNSVHKKNLYRYTLAELKDLLRQLHTMEHHQQQSAQHAGTKAWYEKHGGKPAVN